MTTQKPTLFIGQAIMLDGFGEKEIGKVFYTVVRLHYHRDPIFGRAALFGDLSKLLKEVRQGQEKGSFAKIIFEPPKEIDFRVNSNPNFSTPRRYEALEFADFNTAQRVLDLV